LVSDYLTIAGLLGLPLAVALDQTYAVDAVKRWLGSHKRWLLVLDNADDLAMTREFIPPGNNGHVLITTRAQAVGSVARRVDIQEMETEEGALFLLRRSKLVTPNALLEAASSADQGWAKAIAVELDGLPLALDQAGAYIEESGCGLSDYLSLYRTQGPEFFSRRDETDAPVAFLCYENRDKLVAERLGLVLLGHGIKIWPDKQSVRDGDDWVSLMPYVIENQTNYFVVLQSPRMLDKPESYIFLEIDLALKRQPKFAPGLRYLIPTIAEADPRLPLSVLRTSLCIDLTAPGGIHELAQTILEDWQKRLAIRGEDTKRNFTHAKSKSS